MQLFINRHITSKTRLFELSEEEARHLVKVLRKREGDQVYFTNGKGLLVSALIESIGPTATRISVQRVEEAPGLRSYALHLALAPTKNIRRFEWFLEKATEIGVDSITPLRCTHSAHYKARPERLQKVIDSAVKQSLKAYIPQLNPPLDFERLVEREFKGLAKRIAHLQDGRSAPLTQTIKPGQGVILLIGPEGDFSADEVRLAALRGFVPVSLGNSRLRTETAGVYAAAALSMYNA